jgi:hypothetical protein
MLQIDKDHAISIACRLLFLAVWLSITGYWVVSSQPTVTSITSAMAAMSWLSGVCLLVWGFVGGAALVGYWHFLLPFNASKQGR